MPWLIVHYSACAIRGGADFGAGIFFGGSSFCNTGILNAYL
jgi:hypothetical protein